MRRRVRRTADGRLYFCTTPSSVPYMGKVVGGSRRIFLGKNANRNTQFKVSENFTRIIFLLFIQFGDSQEENEGLY